MSMTLIALLGIIIMVLLIFIGMNIGVAMILVGTVGTVLVTGSWDKALSRLGTIPFTTMSGSSYIVIPLFCLMGEFTLESGMSKGLYDCCAKWMGHRRGGLNLATIVSNALFGAICGAVAGAYYGVPADIRAKAESFLDGRLREMLHAFEREFCVAI